MRQDGELGATPDNGPSKDERGTRRPTKDDKRRTRDEELTTTEPHKCAYIHWGNLQSNREQGT